MQKGHKRGSGRAEEEFRRDPFIEEFGAQI